MSETKPADLLIVINDGPYGSERPYNALRLAMKLVKARGDPRAGFPVRRWSAVRREGSRNAPGLLQH